MVLKMGFEFFKIVLHKLFLYYLQLRINLKFLYSLSRIFKIKECKVIFPLVRDYFYYLDLNLFRLLYFSMRKSVTTMVCWSPVTMGFGGSRLTGHGRV